MSSAALASLTSRPSGPANAYMSSTCTGQIEVIKLPGRRCLCHAQLCRSGVCQRARYRAALFHAIHGQRVCARTKASSCFKFAAQCGTHESCTPMSAFTQRHLQKGKEKGENEKTKKWALPRYSAGFSNPRMPCGILWGHEGYSGFCGILWGRPVGIPGYSAQDSLLGGDLGTGRGENS